MTLPKSYEWTDPPSTGSVKKYPNFPQPMELGPRTIRFKVDALVQWMEKHRVTIDNSSV